MLKDCLSGKQIRFADAKRAMLARKAKADGRKALMKLETIVSPDTVGAAVIRLPTLSPNLNAVAERFIR